MTALFGLADVAFGAGNKGTKIKLFDGPLEICWHHCSTTSELLADLFAQRYQASHNIHKEARHNIGYLVNELIENAVKFRAPGEITIEALIEAEYFKVKVTNELEEQKAEKFKVLLAEITDGDPGDLLIQKIEDNAADPTSNTSGLGLLTLMNDYGARLAWLFSPSKGGTRTCVETFASISVIPEQQ